MIKKALLTSMLIAGWHFATAQKSDTLRVYFETGKSTISQGIQQQVTGYFFKDVIRRGMPIQIVGYADYVGDNNYNDKLSQARARQVKSLLVKNGLAEKDITICIGKGKVLRDNMKGNEGFVRDRRVDIVTNPKTAPEPLPAPLPQAASTTPPKTVEHKIVKAAPVGKPGLQNLNQLKTNETLVLENLYFYPGRHAIRPESAATLQQLYELLKENANIKIQIEGHVCCVEGSTSDAFDFDTREIALSRNRAKMVYDYLVKKGINIERLSYKGFGGTHKIAPEYNDEEADKNRRVEIRIR